MNKPCGHTTQARDEYITWTGLPNCPYCKLTIANKEIIKLKEMVAISAPLLEQADNRIEELEVAITTCLNENGHLADGDNCTLIALKRVMPEWERKK